MSGYHHPTVPSNGASCKKDFIVFLVLCIYLHVCVYTYVCVHHNTQWMSEDNSQEFGELVLSFHQKGH